MTRSVGSLVPCHAGSGISRAADFVAKPVELWSTIKFSRAFSLNVLANSEVKLAGIEIIVFEIGTYGRNSRFLGLLETSLSKDLSL